MDSILYYELWIKPRSKFSDMINVIDINLYKLRPRAVSLFGLTLVSRLRRRIMKNLISSRSYKFHQFLHQIFFSFLFLLFIHIRLFYLLQDFSCGKMRLKGEGGANGGNGYRM